MRKAILFLSMVPLVVLSAVPTSAVVPGQNGRILFTRFICHTVCTDSTPILKQQIVVADANGENEIVLVTEPEDTISAFLNANWSPDGMAVIFARNTCGNNSASLPSGVWTVNADGSGLRQLIEAPAGTCFGQGPTFTPDGGRIVAEVSAEGSGGSLWIMNSDGTGLAPLKSEPKGFADESPQVSPDGTRIAFGRCSSHGCRLATVDIHGGDLRLLPPPVGGSGAPNWSPDSKKLVFNLNANGVTPDIGIINPDGSGFTQLTFSNPKEEGSGMPSFSPDGKRIVFVYFRVHKGEVGLDELFTMNTHGADMTRVTRTSTEEFSPQWSVRGGQIINGDFETGTLLGFTEDGIKGGFANVHEEGTCFSYWDTTGITFSGNYAVTVRSSARAPTDSVGTLTSESFVAGSSVSFDALSESDEGITDPVNFKVRILAADGDVLSTRRVKTNIIQMSVAGCGTGPQDAAFSHHMIDTSMFVGRSIEIQFRQHTNVTGAGFFTLVDNIVAAPAA